MLMQRLRALDRKVLREDVRRTPEQWRRTTSRWWWSLGAAVVLAALVVLDGARWGAFAMPTIVAAYQAGRMRAEHDRVRGRDPYARIRPLDELR